MDPTMIGTSKNDGISHQLNEKEFGALFIGANKENVDDAHNDSTGTITDLQSKSNKKLSRNQLVHDLQSTTNPLLESLH